MTPADRSPSSSRRSFLTGSATAAGALFAAPALFAADAPRDAAKPAPPNDAINPAAASTAANSQIRVALVGAGGQGRGVMKGLLGTKQTVVAVCDPDERSLAGGIKDTGAELAPKVKGYTDHRRLLENAKDFDAVIVATPDHWHAPLCKAFIEAGKHVYCEKPLTRTLGEARQLRELVRANPKVVTQMGNQGSAEQSLRRSVELIRAGALGQVREVHSWLSDSGRASDRPEGEDPIPPGFNWDYWCGPSPYRPYKSGTYHAFQWRQWFDFGGGSLADFTCHIYNTALRALDLGYATKVVIKEAEGLAKESFAKKTHLEMPFAARKQKDGDRMLDPVTLHWYNGGLRPSDDMLKDVLAAGMKVQHGCLIVGEKGFIFCNPWNNDARIKLHGDDKLRGVSDHAPTKDVPITLPRKVSHIQEWVNAMNGQGKAWSDFDFGGHLTEIGLTGVLAVRLGKDIDWDGEAQKANNAPEAEPMIRPVYRKAYL